MATPTSATASIIFGDWKLVSSENQDAYMKEMGMDMVARKLASTLKPTYRYAEGPGPGQITQTIIVPIRNMELVFEWGKEFEEISPRSGRKSKHLVTWDGNKLTHKTSVEGKESLTVREFTETEMNVTSTIGAVTAAWKHKKVAK